MTGGAGITGTIYGGTSLNLLGSTAAITLGTTSDNTAKTIRLNYSSVPMFLTTDYDGSTFGLNSLSVNSQPSGASWTTPVNLSYDSLYFITKPAGSSAGKWDWMWAPPTAGTPVPVVKMSLAGSSGNLSLSSTTASTGVSTGALQVAGGIYAGAASVFGGVVTVQNSGYHLKTANTNNMAAIFGYSDAGTTNAWKIAYDATNLQIGANANVPVEIVSNNVRAALFSPTAATFAGAVTVANSTTGDPDTTANSGMLGKVGNNGFVVYGVGGNGGTGGGWVIGSVSGNLYIGGDNGVSNTTLGSLATFNLATKAATFAGTVTTSAPTGGAGAWELGIANAVSPTSPNRTITIEIGGTVYYLAAKTTND